MTTQSASRPYMSVNPYTNETLRTFEPLSSTEADSAVQAAHNAFASWRRRPIEERAKIVHRAGELVLERGDDLARLLTLEVGKLMRDSQWEVRIAASILKYYGEHGPRFARERSLAVEGGSAVIASEPLGVLLGVEPWNFPFYQAVRFAAPNLVLGNTILLKHAETCPQSALALDQLFQDAGAPAAVYTNIFVPIPEIERIIENPFVRGTSLTGSEVAGASIGELAGRNLKKSVLELGGSDAFIVLDGEYLDHHARRRGRGTDGEYRAKLRGFQALHPLAGAIR